MGEHSTTEIEMVRRHVGEAEEQLRCQTRIIGGLRRGSALERVARQVLASFEATLEGHRRQLLRLAEPG